MPLGGQGDQSRFMQVSAPLPILQAAMVDLLPPLPSL